jgi:hypothetical protein
MRAVLLSRKTVIQTVAIGEGMNQVESEKGRNRLMGSYANTAGRHGFSSDHSYSLSFPKS